jgi:hypothetical protein
MGMDPGFHRGDDKAWITAFAGMTKPDASLCADPPRTTIFEVVHEGREVRNQLPNSFTLSYLRVLRDLLRKYMRRYSLGDELT